jgi:hypothetical protein
MRRPRNRLPPIAYLNSGEVRAFTVELAAALGLNEAILIQQLCYWLERTPHVIDGRYWVYNSYEEWQRQFPWWSAPTIKRLFLKLEQEGLVRSGQFSALRIDRTKWYTVDFERLAERIAAWAADHLEPAALAGAGQPSDQFDPLAASDAGVRPSDQIDPMEKGSERSGQGIDSIPSDSEINDHKTTSSPSSARQVPGQGTPAPRRAADAAVPTGAPPDQPAPSRYRAQPGECVPYLALAELCRHPRDGQTLQDDRTLYWWRYEGRARAGVWRRLPPDWSPLAPGDHWR